MDNQIKGLERRIAALEVQAQERQKPFVLDLKFSAKDMIAAIHDTWRDKEG